MAFANALTKSDNAELTVDQVALAAGLGIDTVRYYQRLGLIPAPVRQGRRAAYCEEHVARLAEIRRLADDGFTLAQIAALGDEPVATDPIADLRRLAVAALDRSLSRIEVADRAGVPEGLVALLVDNGLLAPLSDDPEPRFDDGAVSMVRAGLAISTAGVPLDELVALATDHGAHVDGWWNRPLTCSNAMSGPEAGSRPPKALPLRNWSTWFARCSRQSPGW